MRVQVPLSTALCWLCASALHAQAAEPFIQHVPLNHAEAGPVELRFTIRDADRAGTVVVLARGAIADRAPEAFPAYRTERGYVAVLPPSVVREPRFEYWVVERRRDGSERPLFASATDPHRVQVTLSEPDEAERDALLRREGKRSTVLLAGEYVDFGERRLVPTATPTPDRYYRLEAGYGYHILRTVESITLSVVRVRGEAASLELRAPADPLTRGWEATELAPGIDYGRAEVTLRIADGVRLRGASLLGASQVGFEYGAGGALVLGDPTGSSFTLAGEGITTLGATAAMRLGFALTERLPMGAALELTSFPLGDDAGVRLLYDVGYVLSPGTSIVLRGGFQGRTSVTGGASAALRVQYAF